MADTCGQCVMHESLSVDFKELKKRVQGNEDRALPILTRAKELLDRYPDTVTDLYSKLESTNERTIVGSEAFKAIHTRMDLNDEQRRALDVTLGSLRDELKAHMEEEEVAMRSSRTVFVTVGLFLVGYLISFGVYMHDVSTYNDTRIQLITKDVSYIKSFVKDLKENEDGKSNRLNK